MNVQDYSEMQLELFEPCETQRGGVHPRFVIWENVPGAFSSNGGMDFRAVLEEYTETSIPMPKSGRWAAAGLVRSRRCDVAWRCLDAQYWGVPQRRNRIFLVVDFAETGRCAAEILFKSEGVCGDSASGEGTGQGFTRTAKEGVAGTGDSGGMETQGAVETDKKSTTPDEEIPPIVLKIRQPKVEGRGGCRGNVAGEPVLHISDAPRPDSFSAEQPGGRPE